MKRVFTMFIVALTLAAFSQLQAQVLQTSNFETWSGSHHPAGWVGTKTNIDTTTGIILYTTSAHSPTKAVQLVNATTTHKRFTTTGLSVESGVSYEISFWVRGHGNIRCGATDLTNYSTYTPYHNINSTTWTQYKDTVVGPGTNAAGEFILSVQSTVADLDHLQVDDVVITKLSIAIPTVSIYNIQYTTAVPANSPYANDMVSTGGIVTAVGTGLYFIQSHTGPWNGIQVYDTHPVAIGDSVEITGLVSESFELTEIGSLSSFAIISSGNTLPAPEVGAPVLVNSEAFESCYMRLQNVTCTDTNVGFGMWHIFDGNDTTLVDDLLYHYIATPGIHYNIDGICYYSYSEWKICPRMSTDVSVYSAVQENNAVEVIMYPNPVINELNLFVNGSVDAIQVTDMMGNLVSTTKTNGQSSISIDFSNVSTGNYIVSLLTNGKVTARQVIVK